MKFLPEDLNSDPDPCSSYSTNTYICGLIITPMMHDSFILLNVDLSNQFSFIDGFPFLSQML